jgi:hypothetical protein
MHRDGSVRLLDEELLDELERELARQPGGLASDAPPGLRPDELIAGFERHGVAPSREAVLWWSWRDGSSLQLLPGLGHIAFASSLKGLGILRKLAVDQSAEPPTSDPDVWWNAGWIPIFDTGGLSKIVLDCTGPPDAPSPLRQIDRDAVGADHYARAFVPSLGEYIARAVRSLSAGRYHYDADRDQWLPMDWANTPAGDRF